LFLVGDGLCFFWGGVGWLGGVFGVVVFAVLLGGWFGFVHDGFLT
jgi:hypothetical protein